MPKCTCNNDTPAENTSHLAGSYIFVPSYWNFFTSGLAYIEVKPFKEKDFLPY